MRVFLMRHSKSCSNHLRSEGVEELSQQIRDPGLTAIGQKMVDSYCASLQKKLTDVGFDLDTAIIGSSALLRAKQTAAGLFPGRQIVTIPHFVEYGAIPENTPREGATHNPSWPDVVKWMRRNLPDNGQMIAVGHGSYLRSEVGPVVNGRLNNLDGFLLDMEITPSGWRILNRRRIDYDGRVQAGKSGDRCILPTDIAKIAAHTKMHRSTQRKRYTQRGSGYTMPAAYYHQGAQMYNTSPHETGTDYARPNGEWIRPPLAQRGGFSPSVMGGFVTNGLRYLVPAAGYLAYKSRSQKRKGTQRWPRKKGAHLHRRQSKRGNRQ